MASALAIPLGSGKIGASYAVADDPEVGGTAVDGFGAKMYNIGYEWALSKRTAVGFGYAKIDNEANQVSPGRAWRPTRTAFRSGPMRIRRREHLRVTPPLVLTERTAIKRAPSGARFFSARLFPVSPLDQLITGFDRALRTVAGAPRAARPSPAEGLPEAGLGEAERAHAAALMRVNHVGEVCAQALYQGQALTARDASTRGGLERAAREEEDHLAWSAQRIRELGGRPSLLNPLWYAGALAMGAAAGALGDKWNLAFLAETEHQVEEHLSGHLDALPAADRRTRAVVEAMRADEARHRDSALAMGAAEFPQPVKRAMRFAAKVMTTVAYRVVAAAFAGPALDFIASRSLNHSSA